MFTGCFLAATVLPFSSEALFLLFLNSDHAPEICFVVAVAGNSLGGITNLFLGRFGRRFVKAHKKTIWDKAIVRRYGAWLAWFSWVPFIGDPLLIALGLYRTPLVLTILFMVAGKAARYAFIWYFFS